MTDQRPYWKVALSLFFSLFATAALVLAGIKAIGFFMPFVLGWILSLIISPPINRMGQKLKIAKKLGTAVMVVFVLLIIFFILYFTVSRIAAEIGDIIINFPGMYAGLSAGITKIGEGLSGLFERLPAGVQTTLDSLSATLRNYMGDFVAKIGEPTLAAAGNFAKSLPSYFIGFVVAMVAAYYFTINREKIILFFRDKLPESISERVTLLFDSLKHAVGGYFKGQFKIMGIIFLVLFVGLIILKVRYSALIAFLIAFLDFIPFFGTGTVLIPWALYEFLTHDYKTMATLLVIYVIALVSRQVLQPKLVGESMGLTPLLTLVFLYAGFKLRGIMGFIFAVPLGMVVINMCQAGALNYIFDDARILLNGIMELRKPSGQKGDSHK